MPRKKYPFVSFIIPTLNSQRTLNLCLNSIASQNYPGKTEIIVADGGSFDNTLPIAKKYKVTIVNNPLKTGEAGKAIGTLNVKGEILAFVDSDNVLPSVDWLSRLVTPFLEVKETVASEPLEFTYRRSDHWLTRYFALLGMGDPLNLFIGDYDRYSYITNNWTNLDIHTKDYDNYLILNLKDKMPTIGANGFLIKKSELNKYPVKDYFFDIDVLRLLAGKKTIKVAKVKIGIVHLFSGNVTTFIRKQRRRIRDFLHYRKVGLRIVQPNRKEVYLGVLRFVISCLLIFPLLFQATKGFLRKPDIAWFFHPISCLLTLGVYTYEVLRSPFAAGEFNRDRWSQ